MSKYFVSFNFFAFLFLVLLSSCTNPSPTPPTESKTVQHITYDALTDFKVINDPQYVPAYQHKARKALAIDATKHRDSFAAAQVLFTLADGQYDLTLTSLKETDGESQYKVFVSNQLIGTYRNPETDNDYEAYEHTFKNISIKKGAPIRVEFAPHSNGKIPEADGHAFSRGRWTSLAIHPSKKD